MPPAATEERQAAPQTRELAIRAESANDETGTVQVIMSAGATVQRYDWWTGRRFTEELVVEEGSVRLDRFNNHASVLDNHRGYGSVDETVLGVVERAWIEDGLVVADVRIYRGDEKGARIWDKIKQGFLRHISVGYKWHKAEESKDDDTGERHVRVTDWEPYEGSFVSIPADPGAQARGNEQGMTRNAPEANSCTFVTRGSDMPPEDHRENQTETPETEERSETPETPETPETEERAEERAESAPAGEEPETPETEERSEDAPAVSVETLQRCEEHGLGLDFARSLAGLTEDEANRRILDQLRQNPGNQETMPPTQVRTFGAEEIRERREAASVAILHRAAPSANPLEGRATLFRGMSLLEMARELVGNDARGMSRYELAKRALHATGDFPVILADVMHKTLRKGYDETSRTFLPWTTRFDPTDLRNVHRIQMGDYPSMKKVNEHGEYEYGTFSEGEEVWKLVKYGRIIGMTLESFINDDLGAFTRMSRMGGASAARLQSDVVYDILLNGHSTNMGDGTPLFDNSRDNIATATGAPSEAALNEITQKLLSRKTLDGNHMALDLAYILVPPVHRVPAMKQIAAVTPGSVSEVNPNEGIGEVITEPRLAGSDGTLTDWYASASPNQVDTIEYGFLAGEGEGPIVETRDGFETDGVEFKIRQFFGAKAIDWRGLEKVAGS